jgi:hypothetical protein
MELYEAATGPAHLLKGSRLSGKSLAEKRKSAISILTDDVNDTLEGVMNL